MFVGCRSFDPIHPESALYLMRLELNQIALGPAAKVAKPAAPLNELSPLHLAPLRGHVPVYFPIEVVVFISSIFAWPSQGKTVVACTVLPDEAVDGDIPQPEHCVICTLEPGRTDQCSVDLTFEEDVTFTLISGKGPV